MSVADAAAYLLVTTSTILRWITEGNVLPAGIVHRPAGRYLIDRAALEAWVRTACFAPTPGENDADNAFTAA